MIARRGVTLTLIRTEARDCDPICPRPVSASALVEASIKASTRTVGRRARFMTLRSAMVDAEIWPDGCQLRVEQCSIAEGKERVEH